MFIAVFFTRTKRWKQLKCPLMDEWLHKLWSIHTVECPSASKKKEILTLVPTWINLEDIMLSEINQSQKVKYCMIPRR